MKSRLATCFALAATMLVATTASADKLPDPPSAEITSPMDGAMFEGAPALIDVECEVIVGTGLDNIELFVDDVPVGQLTAAPWTFTDVSLEEGMHSLYVLTNHDGVGDPSATIMVAVVAAGETGETGGEGTGTDGGSGGESSGGTTNDGGETGSSSGNCSTTERSGAAGLLGLGLLGLAVLGLTRRRS